MKRISINLYSIEELSPKAQQYAFQQYQYYNITEFNWYEYTFDDFISICKEIGIELSAKDIFYKGFWSQGNGSTFASVIDLLTFIESIQKKSWKEYAPALELDISPCPCDRRIIQLIKAGHISCSLQTKVPMRGYYLEYLSEYSIEATDQKQYPNIETELKKLDTWVEKCLNVLNTHLYSTLEEAYEYLISNEALTENFMSDQCLFTEDGSMADHLLQFAID